MERLPSQVTSLTVFSIGKSYKFTRKYVYAMSLPIGFTRRQLEIWSMLRDGLQQFEVAKRLGITRQAVHNVVRDINGQVEQALRAVASAAKIEVQYVDPTKGMLLGFSHETGSRVIVTFSASRGAQIWHHRQERCEECNMHANCRELILAEAEERGITLTEEEKRRTASEISRLVFSKILPGVEP